MALSPEDNLNKSENQENSGSKENAPKTEPTPEEFSAWSEEAKNTFTNQTESGKAGLNSVELPPELFDALKNESHVEEQLSALDAEATRVVNDAMKEATENRPELSDVKVVEGVGLVGLPEHSETMSVGVDGAMKEKTAEELTAAEKTKIYENPSDDPLLAGMDKNIQERVTAYLGKDSESSPAAPASVPKTMEAYDDFLTRYPEKAEAYLAYAEKNYAGREDAGVPNWYGNLKAANKMQQEKEGVKNIMKEFGLTDGQKIMVDGKEHRLDLHVTGRDIELVPADGIIFSQPGIVSRGKLSFNARNFDQLRLLLEKSEKKNESAVPENTEGAMKQETDPISEMSEADHASDTEPRFERIERTEPTPKPAVTKEASYELTRKKAFMRHHNLLKLLKKTFGKN